jgi:transcriptional regulator GlxA family with amidase domain
VPPRTYLRALRFQQTFAGLARSGDSLADHAAAHGFADQAHMAREFRALAGQPASRARRRAQPPFL